MQSDGGFLQIIKIVWNVHTFTHILKIISLVIVKGERESERERFLSFYNVINFGSFSKTVEHIIRKYHYFLWLWLKATAVAELWL